MTAEKDTIVEPPLKPMPETSAFHEQLNSMNVVLVARSGPGGVAESPRPEEPRPEPPPSRPEPVPSRPEPAPSRPEPVHSSGGEGGFHGTNGGGGSRSPVEGSHRGGAAGNNHAGGEVGSNHGVQAGRGPGGDQGRRSGDAGRHGGGRRHGGGWSGGYYDGDTGGATGGDTYTLPDGGNSTDFSGAGGYGGYETIMNHKQFFAFCHRQEQKFLKQHPGTVLSKANADKVCTQAWNKYLKDMGRE